ncbi:MotE family protein [Phenylobacterium sp. 58.2.17]|uniref:MotE family protein n=1 Tax=Phenylobacterium sp. 58.2.17 TaxID=2969306 RepID=UPI0022648507|nr:MotE family protein [Phenylobacterium sp. 58.2.17]MCX7585563.1 MotE family protein [Phenylobacterium sp. 58.2.17]
MKNIPRLLPLVGVAMVGVLGLNALAGAESLPDLVSGARAFAEEAAKGAAPAKDAKAATGEAKDAAATVPNLPPAAKPAAVCAPTAAELAKEAGLSPAELQVLQSLGARRGQLDKREQDLDVQLALMAAAEAKLDAKIQALNGMKGDIAKLMVDADAKEQAEIDRLVKVFELMKPKDAAPRMVLLDDAVRLPVASRMKERALSPIIANMPPAEAKKLTEALAARFAEVKKVAAAAQAAAGPLPAAPRAAGQAAAPPAKAG